MKTTKTLYLLLSLCALFLAAFPVFADDEGELTGKVGIGLIAADGNEDSAKFNEYRDVTDGVTGGMMVEYRKGNHFLNMMASNLGLDDQRFGMETGVYGTYRFDVMYDQIPHRYATAGQTLFSGAGTNDLTLPDAMQADLQDSIATTDLNGDGKVDATDNNILFTQSLLGYMSHAPYLEIGFIRKKISAGLDILATEPLGIRMEWSQEDRTGTRPIFGSLGFGGTTELPQPLQYLTTQPKLSLDYSGKHFYVAATYSVSDFKNGYDFLMWDNPFRITDSTNASAYSQTFQNGASHGLMSLPPSNKAHNWGLTGSIFDLPMNSALNLTVNFGTLKQDEELLPYTTNTAIVPGAANNPPFDASDPANLPEEWDGAEVDTTLYNVTYTARPTDMIRFKVIYRSYEYDNTTPVLDLPGYVRTDAVWEPEEVATEPTSYQKDTLGADLTFDFGQAGALTAAYRDTSTERHHREVLDESDKALTLSYDLSALEWLMLKLSYESSERNGDYDYTIPYHGEEVTPQLPWMRKYDQADRDRERLSFLAVFTFGGLNLSTSYSDGSDDYTESDFGLLEDDYSAFSFDADYSFGENASVYGFYTNEQYETLQMARQWTPNGKGDPYTTEPGLESTNNWTAVTNDDFDTYGFGVNFGTKTLKADLSYQRSKSDGEITIDSPVGTTAEDNNPWDPADFSQVDDITWTVYKAKLSWDFSKRTSLIFGYWKEKYDAKDFDLTYEDLVLTSAAGLFNGAIFMDSLVKDYDADVFYGKLVFRF